MGEIVDLPSEIELKMAIDLALNCDSKDTAAKALYPHNITYNFFCAIQTFGSGTAAVDEQSTTRRSLLYRLRIQTPRTR